MPHVGVGCLYDGGIEFYQLFISPLFHACDYAVRHILPICNFPSLYHRIRPSHLIVYSVNKLLTRVQIFWQLRSLFLVIRLLIVMFPLAGNYLCSILLLFLLLR